MLLDQNPELKEALVDFAKANLNDLSAKLLHSYIHETALHVLLETIQQELSDTSFGMEELIHDNQFTKLSLQIVYWWIACLGFKYEPCRKGYYVDGHEKPETILYHSNFINHYLDHELQMHRWVQVPKEEVEEI